MKLELNPSGKTLGEVDIRTGIFQGDSLFPFLFVLCMAPLTWLLRRAKADYELKLNGRNKIMAVNT